jgi:acyl-CoA thioesterase
MAYFRRIGATTFHAMPDVAGAWRTDEQHVAPTFGLLAHLVEQDRTARGRDDLAVTRLSYDIWGTYPLDVMETTVRLLRPGRSVELVEVEMACGGRRAVTLRAWLAQTTDTTDLAGGAPEPIPGPDQAPAWDPTTVWPGAFIASLEARRTSFAPGRAHAWVRTKIPLLDDEEVSTFARTVGLLDTANGMSVRAHPQDIAFPNLDLTADFHRPPEGEWVGFDTTVTFGPTGAGLTHSVLHDVRGPIGACVQSLMVRPLR